ncbi:cilia- and flagella-associated protein 44-like isoform X2 [Tubulanus polymorphus]|uniref:cilia- and flagella-associated protein 44-like isoform X2 n=1 Tax=Tubulanus polymorphus TaxID=672921 RepID=UPI003DA47494
MEDSPKQEEDSVKSKKPTKQSDKPVVNSSKIEVTDTTEPMEESVEQSDTATVAAAAGDRSEVQNDEDKIHEKASDIEAQEVDAVNVQVESESAGDNLNNNADNEPPAADDVVPDEPDTEIGQHQTEEPEQQNVAEVEQLPAEEVDQQETEVKQAAEAADEKETKDGEEKEEDEAAEAIQKQRDDETSDKTAADDEDVDETVKPEMDEKQDAEKEKQDDEAADAEQEELAHEIDEEENTIPEDFYYDKKDHISKALIADESGLPDDMISLLHSFGYDCTKRSNLHLLDEKTIVFVAGNYVELIDLLTKEQSYIRSTSGGGIGAIAVHPSRQFLAVAEKGTAPNINIYEFPSLKLYRILRGGTEAAYAYVDFSPDGKLLASVGGDPDYMLTIWNWKQERIVLRSKAFSQDVFRVTFSTELEGQLTSSGTGHIRFWKMARTFTGLKLQGQLGKFGRTEISDIEGYVELPDGKVLSGSEWGNMLLWDGGLIKVEISRKNHKPCHHGAIQQIVMDEGELMTVGIDGCIRVWDFETIDTADVIDETGIFEMEPMNELQIGNGDVHLKSIVKSVDPDEPTMWYAQDANGGIWKLDLSFSHTSLAPEKILSYHAGAIRGCDTSPVSHLVATAGADCTVRVYDYTTHTQLCESKYTSGGTTLLWPPETVDPKGSSVIAGFEDGVVRVLRFQKKLDIDLGKRSKDTSELVLFQAFKPHIKSVTAFAIDNSGDLLATGSDDCTVFFLTVGRQMEEFYDPIGFVTTPAPVTHLHWSPGNFDKNTLLIFMNDGQVMEIDAPEPGNFDTSKTYQITGLASRLFQFNSCKSQLRHDEEMARKKKEEEQRLRIEEEERRKRKERGQIDSDDEENEVAEERKRKRKEKEEDWSPFIPEEPCAILHGFYSTDSNKFWISMDGFDAGYLYECEFGADKPLRALPVTNSNDVAIQNMKFTNDKRQLLMGLKDGSIRVQSLSAESDDIVDFDTYWTLAMHDNHYGTIDQLALSYDNQFLFTVGHDGNFFTYSMMSQQELEEKIAAAKAKIPSARKPDEMKMTDDIDDPSAYSIEDAKQKAEHDRMMKLADLKKQDVRQTIAQLRHKFKKLLHMNDDLPAHLQLTRQEFEMDPEIKKDLERQTSEKIDIVRKELAWEAEKHRIALEKLKQKFKDIVECDRIVLKAFLTPHEICSYRAAKLSDDFYQLKAEMERRKTTMTTRDDMSRDPTSMLKGRRDVTDGAERERSGTQSDGQIKTTLKGSMGERINKALAKVEEKKRKRALRRSQWNDLYEGKPDDDYEDPADVAAIKEAQENMGDYKLKTAPDYVVPDHLRMNAEKARNRLLILKDLIHHHKYEFNQQLLSLRDKKIRIIDEIKQLVDKLQVVQSKLPETERRPVPSIPKMHPDELPEKKLEYTKDMLLKFKKEMEEKALQELKTGGFGANQFAAPKREATTPASPLPLFRQQTSASAPAEENDDDDDEDADIGPSSLEIQLQKVEEIKLMYERDRLLTRIDNLLKTFDAELRVLRHKKFKSEINMKNADLRQVTLFEELVLLKEFEKSENVLADKMEAKQQEKLDMQAKVLECQQKLDNKRKDIERYQEKERALHAMFLASLGDNNKFAEYLTKVFKKKIKRTKKKATEGEDSEEESDEESDDESDWSDEDEESDEEAGGGLDLDVCPPGCDQSIYDSTCQLREKRLDIEEALTEEKKLNEQFKRDLESLQRKAKVIDGALKTAEGDLEAFQLEKQQKLNELDMVVTLKLHQIQHIVNNAMPQDLTNCLVFESTGLVRLQHRIKELEHEKQLQKKQMKEAKRKHVELIKDRRLFEQRISEMDEQCNHMMQQKFGRIVDLEKLEQVTVNRNLEELKERLRQKEADCANEIAKWEDKIGVKKDRITDLIRENTNRLEQLNMLLGEKKDYEGELDSRQKNLGGEYSGSRKADIHERQRLIQLVQLQAQEIEALKDEITLLSRKGGHILPPAQPPMPQSRTISNINT